MFQLSGSFRLLDMTFETEFRSDWQFHEDLTQVFLELYSDIGACNIAVVKDQIFRRNKCFALTRWYCMLVQVRACCSITDDCF